MRTMIRARALGFLLVVVTAAPAAHAAGRMALLPLATGSADPDVGQLEGALRLSIERVTGRRLESPASTRELIESARRLGVDCQPSDLDCLLKLAVLVELETLLVPSVSLGKDAYKLDLVHIDAASKSVKRAVQHVISPRSETFGKDVEGVAVELLAPEKYVGSMRVASNVTGAEVKLDGRVVGFTPVEPFDNVNVGQHLVVVSKGGVSPFATVVDVRYGQETEVEATLTAGGDGAVAGGVGATDLMFLSGVTLASVGGVLGVLSGCGALGADAMLYTDMGAYAEREAVKNTGVVLLLTSTAALLVAAAGGALLVVTMMAD